MDAVLTSADVQVVRRRGGLELASEDPPLRKALKMQAHKFEVYSSHVQLGKLTFIRYVRGGFGHR
jgi:hypothetical protein